jgi:hypothetical protein
MISQGNEWIKDYVQRLRGQPLGNGASVMKLASGAWSVEGSDTIARTG